MKRSTILVLLFILFTASSHAATAWKSGETKDADGNTVCVYKYGFKKYYEAPDFGSMCPLTIEVSND